MRVLIIGGGPAGLATAIEAAVRGAEAIVFDKRDLPLDKPCGEGLQPPGVRILDEMGVVIPAWGRSTLAGIRYLDGDVVAEGRFLTGPGLGVRRTALIEALVGRARDLGVSLRYRAAVRGFQVMKSGVRIECDSETVDGDFLVGADGLRSRVRVEAGLASRRTTRARFGVRRHFALAPWSSFVEVHWADGVEAYVTPAGPCLVGVALLWSGAGERWDSILRRFPALIDRLAGAPAVSRIQGAGPFEQPVKRRYAGERLALVGDAAGYLDALTGEGLTIGFASARALMEIVTRGRLLSEYETEYRRISRNYYWMTRLVLLLSRHAALRRRVVRALAERPRLFETLLAVNAGELPLGLALTVGSRRPAWARRA